ncbi:lycopene cyclase domain-containing protein [Nocardioides sp. TRM66260-LWL]|uniref:lycopene cyclase domain-containing protein n=1 Tax=Nocardioides sp. TRM66260-LWL TaxID=2874478 RepID=UPI001CC48BB6|nr:lycopene cyclase domain-containing protein [Nocardioides sp. TRM66260-LWL]MBZ5734580.1 lycopene cyclase domain-containing protein [Nocardioides sp. TRM66260-LWL]
MEHGQYLWLMAGCLAITLPLELVLGARVWRRPRRLLRTVLPLVVVYGLWDAAMIARGSWSYSERYTTGVLLPLRIPLEEIVFFVVIPICGLLTLEAVGSVLHALGRLRAGEPLGRVLRELPRGVPEAPATADDRSARVGAR